MLHGVSYNITQSLLSKVATWLHTCLKTQLAVNF